MAGRIIVLKFAGKCRECQASIPAGDKARWYGKGIVYCVGEHRGNTDDGYGIRWNAKQGRAVQYNGMCEDAPCCGCCGTNVYGGHD